MLPDLLDQIKALLALVRKNKAVNVNSDETKQSAISTGSYYFKSCRANVSALLRDDALLAEMDDAWQRLIKLAHGNNAKHSYQTLLKWLFKKTTDLNVASHASIPANKDASSLSYSEAERILLSTLDQLLPSAGQSYRQGLLDLTSGDTRASFRGTACEFREAFRETLDLLAPDADVTAQLWFKLEPKCNGPTMKQKVRFILGSRGMNKTQRALAEQSMDLIEELCGDIARAAYNRASVSTHVQTSRDEVIRLKRYLDAVFFDILEIGRKE